MRKNKLLYIVLIALCLIITGCIESEDESKNVKEVEPVSNETTNIGKANIKEQVIVDKDGIKVTAKSIDYDGLLGPEIKLLFENNSSQDVTIQSRDLSINGIMIDSLLSTNIAIGKKANDGILIYTEDLKTAKITAIKDIELSLEIFNSDTLDDIFKEENINLKTNISNYTQIYNTDGTLVVNQNNIKIYVLKLDDKNSFWGADIYVYIENNSFQDVTVQARDVSINGFMVDPAFSAEVKAGKKAYDSITFFESDLEENNIKDITEMELKFNIFNTNTFNDIFETGIQKINF